MERRLSAIFAADMVGYSRLMEADEVGTLERGENILDCSVVLHDCLIHEQNVTRPVVEVVIYYPVLASTTRALLPTFIAAGDYWVYNRENESTIWTQCVRHALKDAVQVRYVMKRESRNH